MDVGPVDVVVVAFPGNQFSGSILPGLNDLVQVRTVALLDSNTSHSCTHRAH